VRNQLKQEIESIHPLDSIEGDTINGVLAWIDSGVELCRIEKPATPNKHLVSYFVVIDGDYLLLVDHINAEKWLPTGGHVESGEHPRKTVIREAYEELKIQAEFIQENPVFLTSTETVGKTSGHTDVCLWYVIKGNRNVPLEIDTTEFYESRWFNRNLLPANSDPNLSRFVNKLFNTSRRKIKIRKITDE